MPACSSTAPTPGPASVSCSAAWPSPRRSTHGRLPRSARPRVAPPEHGDAPERPRRLACRLMAAAAGASLGLYLVDGGYYDNSGAATGDLLVGLRRAAAALRVEDRIRYVAIVITNDPVTPPSDAPVAAHGQDRPKPGGSILDPLVTVEQVREGLTSRFERNLKQHIADSHGLVFDRFTIVQGDVQFPLGWMLSGTTRIAMDKQVVAYRATTRATSGACSSSCHDRSRTPKRGATPTRGDAVATSGRRLGRGPTREPKQPRPVTRESCRVGHEIVVDQPVSRLRRPSGLVEGRLRLSCKKFAPLN